MKTKFIVSTSLFLLLITACAPASGAASSQTNSLSVTGQSQVSLVPNIAYVSIGVRVEASDVSEAVSQNASQAESVMQALEDAGIARSDMQTINFSVYSYDQRDFEGNPTGLTYSVENTVYVTVRDLSAMGDLLDSAVSAGANSIWGIQFDVDDKSAAVTQVRSLAMQDAKAQATQLAADAGVSLGDINNVSFSTGGGSFNSPYGVGGGGAAVLESTVIIPGQITVSGSVFLSYNID